MVRWYKKSTVAGWKQCLPCTLHPIHTLHVLYERPASREAGRVVRGMAGVIWNVVFLGLNSKGPTACGWVSSAYAVALPLAFVIQSRTSSAFLPQTKPCLPVFALLLLSVYFFSGPTLACSLASFLHNSAHTSSHLNRLWERAAPATAAIGKGGV